MKRPTALIAAALALGGSTPLTPVPTRAEAAAALLLSADAAAARAAPGSRRTLADLLDALDRMGVRAEPGDDDPLPSWRAVAGRTAVPLRGRLLGPAFRRGTLAAGGEMRMQQLFAGGEQATIALAALPRDVVTLSVTGPDRAEACATPRTTCRWMPVFTQRYTISLRNTGAQAARVYLVVD